MENMDIEYSDATKSVFVQTFKPGDKVYGLAGNGIGRDRYICTPEFLGSFGSLDYTTDQLNNRFLGTGPLDGPSIYYSALMYGIEPSNLKLSQAQVDEVDAFRMFLENHPKSKYRPRNCSEKDNRDTRVSRACKAALEFTTIKMDRRIHFILDDINIWQVANKDPTSTGSKSITGQELRYIYRNQIKVDFDSEYFARTTQTQRRRRSNYASNVQEKPSLGLYTNDMWNAVEKVKKIVDNIVFWFEGKQTDTPWSTGTIKDVWYEVYGRDYDSKITKTKSEMQKSMDWVKGSAHERFNFPQDRIVKGLDEARRQMRL